MLSPAWLDWLQSVLWLIVALLVGVGCGIGLCFGMLRDDKRRSTERREAERAAERAVVAAATKALTEERDALRAYAASVASGTADLTQATQPASATSHDPAALKASVERVVAGLDAAEPARSSGGRGGDAVTLYGDGRVTVDATDLFDLSQSDPETGHDMRVPSSPLYAGPTPASLDWLPRGVSPEVGLKAHELIRAMSEDDRAKLYAQGGLRAIREVALETAQELLKPQRRFCDDD